MTIKKLCKFIVALSLIVPCTASEFDVFQYRLINEGRSFLIESGIIPAKDKRITSPQDPKNNKILDPLERSPVSSTATTPDLFNYRKIRKTFVLNELPELGYMIKTEEQNLFNTANKIKDENTIDVFEQWKTIAYNAIEQGYQIVLKLLLENAKNNLFIKIALSEQNVQKNLKQLDAALPGIYDYVIKITNFVDSKRI